MDKENKNNSNEALIACIRDRAHELYITRQMLCAEAVLCAINQGLNGGLTDTQVAAMAAPFCAALGESGCLCGALSGAVMASGLLLGQKHVYRRRQHLRNSARRLHDAFKFANGSTCCRALTQTVGPDVVLAQQIGGVSRDPRHRGGQAVAVTRRHLPDRRCGRQQRLDL